MGKVIGLGGIFLKANDPRALAAWYQEKLGIDFGGNVYVSLPFTGEDGQPAKGSNVLSFSGRDDPYFAPSTAGVMLNLRVDDLKSMLEDLKAKGVEQVGEPMYESYGKFGWILDLEGNKVELWEP